MEINFAHINDLIAIRNVNIADINPMGFGNSDVADLFENRENDN